jgi:hypothetical protein
MLMDDIGALFWRFGKKLLASSGENEHAAPGDHAAGHSGNRHEPPAKPAIVHSPAAE